jgi:membrane-associated phospholipid phosphatase
VPSRAARVFSEFALAGLVLSVAAALILGWLAEEVMEGDTARFDSYIRSVVHSAASPNFTSAMWFFTDLGSLPVLPAIIAVALVALWAFRWRRAAVILIVTLAGGVVLDEALKYGFHRKRPTPYFGIAPPHSFSFPSGHALFSFAFFATLAALTSSRLSKRRIRVAIWTMAVLLIALIGFSRIYLGVHYPTDVIAGYLTAFIWVRAISYGDRFFSRRERVDSDRDDPAHSRSPARNL